jgi:hypothetical protein
MVAGVGDDFEPAAAPHGPLGRLAVADGAAIEQAIDLGVGCGAALAHGGGESGMRAIQVPIERGATPSRPASWSRLAPCRQRSRARAHWSAR